MKIISNRALATALLPFALAACGRAEDKAGDKAGMEGMEKGGGSAKPVDKDLVTLTARQIEDAGIESRVRRSGVRPA